jgi:hypothetical protein
MFGLPIDTVIMIWTIIAIVVVNVISIKILIQKENINESNDNKKEEEGTV